MLYLLQVNVGLILFYALYKLVCTRDTLFQKIYPDSVTCIAIHSAFYRRA